MSGMLREDLLAALDPLDDRGDLRAVLDDDVALVADLVGQELAGDLARLDVVGLHRGVGPCRRDVDRDDDDAGRLRPLDGRRDRLGSAALSRIRSTPEAMKLSIWVNCLFRS